MKIMDYKTWCTAKGYKTSNAKSLIKYYAEARIQKERFIKSKISLYGDTLESLAEYLGIARQTLSRKINGETDFTLTELTMLKYRYKLNNDEFVYLCTKEIVNNEYSGSSEAVK